MGDLRHWFTPLRSFLTTAVIPIQYSLSLPASFVHWIDRHLVTSQQLLKENTELKERLRLLQVTVQKNAFLVQENTELRSLLNATQILKDQVITAQLLTMKLDHFNQEVLLNRGKEAGIYAGQLILDAYGVMGQIVTVGEFTSRALLLTDAKSAIPVINLRTGMQTIVVGNGGELTLLHIPDTADLQINDLLVTSALASHVPDGYPVGIVTEIKHIPGEQFAVIKVRPIAHIGKSRYVFLVKK